jgi:hypothetical protein
MNSAHHQLPVSRLAKSLKIHLAVYLPVNLLFIGLWAAAGGGYFWPVWTVLGWGLLLACHMAPLVARFSEHPAGTIRLRIGLHTGEAIKDEADFYGKNVALAARITDQARGGEILASAVVKQLTESAGDVHFEDERELELDGLAGTQTVYRVRS